MEKDVASTIQLVLSSAEATSVTELLIPEGGDLPCRVTCGELAGVWQLGQQHYSVMQGQLQTVTFATPQAHASVPHARLRCLPTFNYSSILGYGYTNVRLPLSIGTPLAILAMTGHQHRQKKQNKQTNKQTNRTNRTTSTAQHHTHPFSLLPRLGIIPRFRQSTNLAQAFVSPANPYFSFSGSARVAWCGAPSGAPAWFCSSK